MGESIDRDGERRRPHRYMGEICRVCLKEFYLPKYIEQQYKKWQQIRQWKDQTVQSYTNEFYRLMARLGVQ